MRTLPEQEAEEKQEQGRRSPWRAFRLLSFAGAMVLLFLLVVALLLPEGAILALRDKAAPEGSTVSPMFLAMAIEDTQPATVTITATLPVEESPTVTLDQLPAADECSGCIHIWLIDRYERKGIGENWRVAVTYPDGQLYAFLVPAGGDFTIPTGTPPPGLCGGTYQVDLEVPDGWEPITPASVPVTLTGTEQGKCAEVRFEVGLLPTLRVVKLDQAGPGGKPAGIPDWKMTVTDDKGVALVGTTNGLGEVDFPLPHLGEWLVTEEVKIGWQPVDPSVPSQAINVVPPATPTGTPWIVTATFLNKQIRDGCIEIIKKDSAGELLDGWTMTVRRVDGTFADTVRLTGADGLGRALICRLPMGEYTVIETVQPWYRADKKIGASQPATLTTPGATVSVTFVNEPLGCIDGYKVDYLNRGLVGWEINVTNELTGDRFATVTNAQGYFYFPDLPFGPYTIEEVLKDRWSPVTAPGQQVNVLQRGPECIPVRFENIRDSACLETYKGDASDPNEASPSGYSGVAGIKITLRPAYGGTPIELVTDGTGRAFFDQLTPGMYVVEEALTDPWVAVSATMFGPFELGASEPCWPLNSTGPVVFMNRQETMTPPEKSPPPPKSTATPTGSTCRYWYTVRPGDTLYSIARRYGSTVSKLTRANHICNPNLIYVGQKLCIP
jgi:hypothetical protein